MRKPKILKIALIDLKFAARQAPDSPDLDPLEYKQRLPMIIVERIDGRFDIIDGYHRAAGLVGWAKGEELSLADIVIKVIDATGYDDDVLAAASDPDGFEDMSQEDAIAQIEEDAGAL